MHRLVLPALALLALLLAGCGGEAFQPTRTAALVLGNGDALGQTFLTATDDLAGIDLLVATLGETPDPDGTLTLALRDGPDGPVIAETSRAGEDLDDNRWVALRFAAPAQAPERAAIIVTWDGDEPIALHANVPPADLDGERLENQAYPGGQLLRDGQPAAGDLAFRVVPGSAAAALGGTVARLAAGAARGLFAQPLFGVIWLLLTVGALAAGVYGLRRGRRVAGDRS